MKKNKMKASDIYIISAIIVLAISFLGFMFYHEIVDAKDRYIDKVSSYENGDINNLLAIYIQDNELKKEKYEVIRINSSLDYNRDISYAYKVKSIEDISDNELTKYNSFCEELHFSCYINIDGNYYVIDDLKQEVISDTSFFNMKDKIVYKLDKTKKSRTNVELLKSKESKYLVNVNDFYDSYAFQLKNKHNYFVKGQENKLELVYDNPRYLYDDTEKLTLLMMLKPYINDDYQLYISLQFRDTQVIETYDYESLKKDINDLNL